MTPAEDLLQWELQLQRVEIERLTLHIAAIEQTLAALNERVTKEGNK